MYAAGVWSGRDKYRKVSAGIKTLAEFPILLGLQISSVSTPATFDILIMLSY